MLPLNYAIRNLFRSVPRTMQMIFGAALVVILIMSAEAFTRGMDAGLSSNGNPNNILLVGAGSEDSLERSQISASTPDVVAATISGLKSKLGQLALSPEIHYSGLLNIGSESKEYEMLFRGVTTRALMVHPQVELLKGKFPGPGEVIIGRQTHKFTGIPLNDLAIGKIIKFGRNKLKISGIFQAPGTMMESEIWLNANDLMDLTRRRTYSCIVLTLADAKFKDIDNFCKQRLDLELSAIPETTFYRRMSEFFKPIKQMTWLTALLITLGAVFGGLNTMYAAYISRRKEMATLQAVGYSRRAIYLSLLQESIIANMMGTVIAMFFAIFVLNGITVAFATGVFYLEYDMEVLLLALITGFGLGFIGTAVPAWNSLKPPLISSLRV